MRAVIVFIMTILVCIFTNISNAVDGVTIRLDEIVMNDHIVGTVIGLTNKGRSEHKVVVYVRTDKWYIHPYERGEDGKSWASIGPKGVWKIQTIRREFAASAVAALLIERYSKVPARVMNVRGIPHKAIVVRELEGTPDYGKL